MGDTMQVAMAREEREQVRVITTCVWFLCLVPPETSVDKEAMARLAEIPIYGAAPDRETRGTPHFPHGVRSERIATADELVRLSGWALATQPLREVARTEAQQWSTVMVDANFLSHRRVAWCVREFAVVNWRGWEYMRWTAAELAATIAEMRACGKAAPIDPAEPVSPDEGV